MRKKQFENVIKFLEEKGYGFHLQYKNIYEAVKNGSQTSGVEVDVEGHFEDLGYEFKSTGSKEILTRVTITEGNKKTIFVIKNVTRNDRDNCGESLNWLAKVKYIEKGLIFKRKTEYNYYLSRVDGYYYLTSTYSAPMRMTTVLGETRLTLGEVFDIIENDKRYDAIEDMNQKKGL